MLFAVIATDKDGGLQTRLATREEHIAYLKSLGDTVKIAGPFVQSGPDDPNGSLVIVEADDMAAAEELAANDPYAKAGLFQSVEIRPWIWTVGAPAGR
jgi:uncharacterized protein YciI